MVFQDDLKERETYLKHLRERNIREQSKRALEEEIKKEEMSYHERHMGTLERGLKGLPSQIKRDLDSLKKSSTSPQAKKKISRIRRMLDI
jgi:hypothetical protein